MSTIEQSIKELMNLLEKNDLLRDDIEEENINDLIEDIKQREKWGSVSPLEVMHLSKIPIMYIRTYDDCNIYENPHYYEEILNEICRFSNGDIELSNISESWDEDSNVTLSFFENGNQKTLSFNVIEEKDIVPEIFVNYVHHTLTEYDGHSKYLSSFGPNGELFFFRIDNTISDEVSKIMQSYDDPNIFP
jgi:hypothetical protein